MEAQDLHTSDLPGLGRPAVATDSTAPPSPSQVVSTVYGASSSYDTASVTSIIAASGNPTPSPPSNLIGVTLSSSSSPSATNTAQTTRNSSSGGGLSNEARLAAILVPTLVVLALIPVVYICWIHQRYKKRRRESAIPEVRQQPPETGLLHAHHPSHDSVSLPTPFTDSERARDSSIGAGWDPHQEETSRAPSPVLPSPSRHTFRTQEQWPLSGPLPEPPPPPPKYSEDNDSFRSPSSNYGSRQAMLPRPPSEHEEAVSPQEQVYENDLAIKNRQSDAVSELSYDSRSRKHRTKSMDGESFISAMEEEPVHDPMPTRHII